MNLRDVIPTAENSSNFNVVPESITEVGTTLENLKAAVCGETGASAKYAACAAAAKEQGFDQIARLFEATSAAEQIHIGLEAGVIAEIEPGYERPAAPDAEGIAITDRSHVLAYEGSISTTYVPGTENAKPTLEVLESKRMETFVSVDAESQDVRRFSMGNRREGHAFGIIVPLLVQDRAVGAIKFYYRRDVDIDRTQLAIAEGLGSLLSTQLSSYELDRQAELTARAEVKALQAQINPHFLFNTLNTIASFTRTNPTRARDLLREFSTFYRRTLESSEKTLIPLSQELEQTRRYLKIEKARFGEDRIVETEHVEEGCGELEVPSFLVQPIVENAVRHAMRDEGALHVDVQVATDGDDILIAVADDGLGMDKAVAERLLAGATEPGRSRGPAAGAGTGMALRNVAERIERFFGVGSGVEIVSKPGEGTCVTLRLAGARRKLAGGDRRGRE